MPVTIGEYRKLIADRPRKFTETEVRFAPPSRNNTDYYCKDCSHWFESPGAKRSVCEIMRKRDDSSVEPKAKCMFWTRTGMKFPLLEQN
jgi:hypothetical protein